VTNVSPVRNEASSWGRDPTKQPATPSKKLKRNPFQVWVEGSEAGEFIPMTHRSMKRSERSTEEQLSEREHRPETDRGYGLQGLTFLNCFLAEI